MRTLLKFSLAVLALLAGTAFALEVRYFKVPAGAGPHDVAPAPYCTVWYTAQRQRALGRLEGAGRLVVVTQKDS